MQPQREDQLCTALDDHFSFRDPGSGFLRKPYLKDQQLFAVCPKSFSGPRLPQAKV
jgi:hypothetical protein